MVLTSIDVGDGVIHVNNNANLQNILSPPDWSLKPKYFLSKVKILTLVFNVHDDTNCPSFLKPSEIFVSADLCGLKNSSPGSLPVSLGSSGPH